MAQQAIELRIKEQRILISSFNVLAKTATYLCAASFAVLRCTPAYLEHLNAGTAFDAGWRHENDLQTEIMTSVTMGLASASIGFNILILLIASWCIIFGSELAFRGQDEGSMSRAVDGLYEERKMCVFFYMSALACTLLSGISHILLFIQNKAVAMIPAVSLFVLGFLALAYMRERVRPRFDWLGIKRADAEDLYFHGGYNPEQRRRYSTRGVSSWSTTSSTGDIFDENRRGLANPLVEVSPLSV